MKFKDLGMMLPDEDEDAAALSTGFILKIELDPNELQFFSNMSLPDKRRFGVQIDKDSHSLVISSMTGTVGHMVKGVERFVKWVSENNKDMGNSLRKLLTDLKDFEAKNNLSLGASGKDENYRENTIEKLKDFNDKFKSFLIKSESKSRFQMFESHRNPKKPAAPHHPLKRSPRGGKLPDV